MIEQSLALIGLLACAGLLLRMVLPARQRAAWDGFWRRGWHTAKALGRALQASLQQSWRQMRGGRAARREAADVIARAREKAGGKTPHEVERDGNVIRPSRFGHKPGGRDDRTLH